jgi:hypothetical protein
MLSIVIMLVAEVYSSLPPDTSTVALISLLLVRDLSTDQTIRPANIISHVIITFLDEGMRM